MKIDTIMVKNDGYIYCESEFYSVHDILDKSSDYKFSVGVNTLYGGIDSGNWGVSYLLSMFKYNFSQSSLFLPYTAVVNNETVSLEQLWQYTCYMDKLYPLFSEKKTARQLVLEGIRENGILASPEDICDLFYISPDRFERPISGMGNERFKAMAAIGYSHGKEVFCFPWFSKKRLDGFHNQIPGALTVLESLKKVVILPLEQK